VNGFYRHRFVPGYGLRVDSSRPHGDGSQWVHVTGVWMDSCVVGWRVGGRKDQYVRPEHYEPMEPPR
jgi:hypothetical protein